MTEYNPYVLQEEADRIYKKADGKQWAYAMAGVMVGALGLAGITANNPNPEPNWAWLIIIVIPALFGFFVGRDAAHRLRVKAQLVLVQVQIEKNTRPQK